MPGYPENVVGWVRIITFVPIVVCSIVGFALALAKWRQTRWTAPAVDPRLAEFRALVSEGEYTRALSLAGDDAPVSVRLAASLVERAAMTRGALKDHAELLGRQLVRDLEYGLGGLAVIATLGPLFGLLGTVVGIILIFDQVSATAGSASPQQLAGGIGTALYTTVAGLVVGVSALVSHRLVAARADLITADLEATALEFIELVCEHGEVEQP